MVCGYLELKRQKGYKMELNNKYYLLRHGEAVSNAKNIASSWPEKFNNPLTKRSKEKIIEAAEELENKKIDLIFASDLLRTKKFLSEKNYGFPLIELRGFGHGRRMLF